MSKKSPLTPKQSRTLEAIRTFHVARGYMPSVRDLMRKTGAALGTVHYHLEILQSKGWIRRTTIPRSIELRGSSAATRSVPIIETVIPGQPLRANKTDDAFRSLLALKTQRKSFAVRVRGNRWAKFHILDADVVIVDPDAKVMPGALALTTLRAGRIALRRIRRTGARPQRHSSARPQGIGTAESGVVTGVIRALA